MSTKTEKAIERDVFLLVKTYFTSVIKGTVYRKGMRPKDAKTEDIIVAFSSGLDGQFQSGEVYVNIYVPFINISQESNMTPDIKRIDKLEECLNNFFDDVLAINTEYLFNKRNTPDTIDEESIEQSIISLLITFNRFTS